MKACHLALLFLLVLTNCRPASYSRQGHLDRSIFQILDQKILVADLATNVSNAQTSDYSLALFAHLNTCASAEVLDMDRFYNQYQFGYAAAKELEEQLSLLNQYTDVQYLVIPYIRIEANSLLPVSHEDWIGKNAAVAGIEVYDVQQQQLLKYVQYAGSVSNEGDNADGNNPQWELVPSSQRIVKNCYEKSLTTFLRYTNCGKNRILP